LLLLVVAGCGAPPVDPVDPAGSGADPLRGHTFLAAEVTVAGEPHELVGGTEVSLDFTEDGRLVANAGCNTMSGKVTTADGRLDVGGGLAMTEMGCDPPRHDQDEWLAGVLGAGPEWRLAGSRLVVSTADTELVLEDREVADPDRPLTETTWAVDTLVDGDAASSTPAGATATLEFAGDRVLISAGCNGGSAGYTVSGDTIRFERPQLTLMACAPDIMRLEAAVLAVVGDEAELTFEVEADRLRLNHPSGKGLGLHAK